MSVSWASIQLACSSSDFRMPSSRSRLPWSPRLRHVSIAWFSMVTAAFSVEPELFRDGLADVDLAELLHIRRAFEVENPRDELIGVAHLADGLAADFLPEPLVAPVLAHARVDEVLIVAVSSAVRTSFSSATTRS